jgi:hypothetical protein
VNVAEDAFVMVAKVRDLVCLHTAGKRNHWMFGCVGATRREEECLVLLVCVWMSFRRYMTDDAGEMTPPNFAELIACMLELDFSENPV